MLWIYLYRMLRVFYLETISDGLAADLLLTAVSAIVGDHGLIHRVFAVHRDPLAARLVEVVENGPQL